MENEDEILNIEKEKAIIDKTKNVSRKKSLFKRYELHIYIIIIFIIISFFFFILYLDRN